MSGLSDASTSPASFQKSSSNASRVFTVGATDAISPLLRPTHISNLRLQGKLLRSGPRRKFSMSSSRSASPEPAPSQPEGNRQEAHPGTAYQDLHGSLVKQIIDWLHEEKQKHSPFSTSKLAESLASTQSWTNNLSASPVPMAADATKDGSTKHYSELALERLESIIAESKAHAASLSRHVSTSHRPFLHKKRSSVTKRSRRTSLGAPSSDTEYVDGDAFVPSVDVVLDNSKTMGYTGGAASGGNQLSRTMSSRSIKEDNWFSFKSEIIKLAHTLRLKGWRRVPLDGGADIDVRRLSGALTNAVYVVIPPKRLPEEPSGIGGANSSTSQKYPRKLLLRIYGPQVEHLIDREAELETLRRLARKNIGPRLLGTFQNGRFEEFLNAQTLGPEDLLKPETYRQIAKRMRELHDGIDLLDHERARGPFVWQNWDKWVARCEEVITWLDEQILAHRGPVKSKAELWKTRGFVCGVEWPQFRKAVETYRRWLIRQYGGEDRIKARLVFCHNDTQHGNLLRLVPTGESPLLLPANEHKQLVVIDFEYANANLRGLEFANHFTEWCYNYQSPTQPYACNTAAYPTPKDQQRFISSYVQHITPSFSPQLPPKLPHQSSTSSISSFMLDSRGPINQYDAEEAAREEQNKAEVEQLMKETRLWRVANSAQWVAWGIVQAKVSGMDEALEKRRQEKVHRSEADSQANRPSCKDHQGAGRSASETEDGAPASTDKQSCNTPAAAKQPSVPHEHETDDDQEFDNLAYAQQRALFFWGDLLELGLIKNTDLPESVLPHIKRLSY